MVTSAHRLQGQLLNRSLHQIEVSSHFMVKSISQNNVLTNLNKDFSHPRQLASSSHLCLTWVSLPLTSDTCYSGSPCFLPSLLTSNDKIFGNKPRLIPSLWSLIKERKNTISQSRFNSREYIFADLSVITIYLSTLSRL